ncbi:MAG: PQQ-binding-like beta-propeller repeat protein [Ignavibacteriaceae bacterium]|nr:PQQ-binding-like beta-propeller repeat protein [Ignavibacteriaceae bacterium]
MKWVLLLISLLLTGLAYPQQQHHIPWPSLADSPWPNTRGDAQATGRSKYVGPSTPNVILRKDMPFGILHGPVIGYSDDLFVGTRAFRGFTGDTVNFFYSLDKMGNNIWTFITEGTRPNVAGATIAIDGTIYFSSLGYSNLTGGGLYALNPDGTVKWQNEKFVYTYFTRFIPIGKDYNLYMPFIDTLYILEPLSGNTINSIPAPNITDHDIVFSTGGDTIFYFTGRIFTTDSKKLNATTVWGEHLWSVEFHWNTHNRGTPVVDNENRIYIFAEDTPSDKFLYCINPNGTINWKYPLDSNENYENYSSPTIDSNGNIIFPSSKFVSPNADSGYITSLDYNGNPNWKISIGHYWDDGAFINSGLVCDAQGKIYCGSSYGISTNFWCIDNNGTILWKLDLEGYEYDTSPAINSEGTLYIGTHLDLLFQDHERNLMAINDTVTFVEINDNNILSYRLEQNYPNPFNSTTHIDFLLMERSKITLKIFNALGQEINTLVDEEMIPGYYSRTFYAKDLPSGIYFYTLTSGNFMVTKKLILLK